MSTCNRLAYGLSPNWGQKPHNGLVLAGDCILAVSEIINRSSQRPLTGKCPGKRR